MAELLTDMDAALVTMHPRTLLLRGTAPPQMAHGAAAGWAGGSTAPTLLEWRPARLGTTDPSLRRDATLPGTPNRHRSTSRGRTLQRAGRMIDR